MTEPKIQETIDAITAKFQKRIDEIKKEGSERINDITDDSPNPNSVEATLDLIFEVKMKTTSIKFDIPKFSMERQEISFDVPGVTMVTKTFSWDEPATRMVRRCITKKPEFKCSGFIPKCTVKWTCVYADVPEAYMKRREIKTDIPVFKMKRQDISFDKPVVRFETVEIKLDLPQFYLRSLSGELKDQQNEIEDVSGDMTADISKAKNEMDAQLLQDISAEITAMYEEIRTTLLDERTKVSGYYDDAISKMKSAIKSLKENNATGEVVKMEAELSKLVTDYSTILADLDKGIDGLNAQEAEALKNLKIQ